MAKNVRKMRLVAPLRPASYHGHGQRGVPAQELVRSHLAREYPSLFELYKHLHSHPELSFQETQSAARVADETAFFLMGELIEFDKSETIFTNPRDKRTEDYVTGRFG